MKTHFKTGVYNIPISEYHASDGFSRSQLMEFLRSPYHFWGLHLNPERPGRKETDSLVYGNALHCFLLERERFDSEFCVAPKFGRKKSDLEAKEIFLAENGHKCVIKEEWLTDFYLIERSLDKNSQAKQLLQGEIEQSIYWQDDETGLLLKCRPDVWRRGCVVDLKTAKNGQKNPFQSSIYQYGYHIQAAMIQEGILRATGQDVGAYVFVAIEKEYPFCVSTYILDNKALEKGHETFREILKLAKKCLDTDNWPQYAPDDISLPAYAFKTEDLENVFFD